MKWEFKEKAKVFGIENKTKEILIFTPEGFLVYIIGIAGVSCLLTVIILLVTGSLK